jgi:catechol 2,3-dioxygenase-like lactoylglutathione lyase family enzyme
VLGFELLDKAPRDTKNQSFVSGILDADVVIAYMQCPGHQLALFQYSGPEGRATHKPRMVDVGHFHLSFVVDDIDAVVAACKSYDGRIRTLSVTPMAVDQGPNKGNTIQFVVLPDGVHIEFTTRKGE